MIHQVFANRTNAGDWLSARGIRSLLAPLPTQEHLCDDPFVAATLDRLALAAPQDLVVVGGGGLLMDYFAPLWEGLVALAPRVRFCLWGVGVCDVKNSATLLPRPLLERIVRASVLTFVRDEHTRDVLGRDGLPPPVACPTFVAVEPRPPAGRGVLHVDNLGELGEAAYEAMDAAARDFAAATDRRFAKTNNLVESGDEAGLARVLGLYAAADVVVTSRLHGCILALATGRRVVAVSPDRKVDSFMAAAGLSEWVLDAGDVDRLPSRLAAIDRQPSACAFVDAARRAQGDVAAQVLRLAS